MCEVACAQTMANTNTRDAFSVSFPIYDPAWLGIRPLRFITTWEWCLASPIPSALDIETNQNVCKSRLHRPTQRTNISEVSFWLVSAANEEKAIQWIRNHKQSFISQGSIVGNTRMLKYGKLFFHRQPNFITLYFHEPDYTAHRQGPDAEQVE